MKALSIVILVISVIAIIITIKVYKKNKFKNIYLYSAIILCILNGLLVGIINVDFLNDQEYVTIKAYNAQNANAEGNEIWINSISVYGDLVEIQEPIEGKWIWDQARLGWRTYDLPYEITDNIVIGVPLGKERTINFEKNLWRGIVEVIYNGNKQIIDCYAEKDIYETLSVHIEDTNKKAILDEKIRSIVFIILSYIFLSILELVIIILIHSEKIKLWIIRSKNNLIYGGIAIVSLIFTFCVSKNEMFWGDEIYQVSISSHGIRYAIESSNAMIEYNPPFFGILASIWYKITPYGERWLLLLPMLLVAIGIYIIGICGEKISNMKGGIIGTVCASVSSSLIIYAAQEFRPYALLFCFSAITMYYYVQRNINLEEKREIKNIILFGLTMGSVAYAHNFGVFFCGMYFLYDIFLWKNKEIDIKNIWAYILAGILYLPRIYFFLISSYKPVSHYPGPTLSSIYNVIDFICSQTPLVIVMLFITILIILTKNRAQQRMKTANVVIVVGLILTIVVG